MISTTVEQSKRLIEAGIGPQTADMWWFGIAPESRKLYADQPFLFEGETLVTPAWSLPALILLLPEHAFYRIARARGKDIEGIFEDCVKYLCLKSDDEKRFMMVTL